MKKTFIMNKLFVGLLAFIFLSCSNAIQPKENVEKTDNSPAYICVKSAALSDSSRTALPSTSISSLSDLVLTGNKTGTIPTELARSDTFSELSSNVIEIEPGSWSFTLSANLNGVAFSGTSSAVVVGGQSASLGFLLSSSADDGGFSITVYFDGEADSVTGVIYDTYSDGSPYYYYYLGESMVISNRSRLENSLVIRQNEEGQNYVIFEIPVNENFGLNEGSYRAEITFSKNNVELNTYSTSVQIVNSYISKAVAFMQLCSEPYSITFNLNGGSFPPAQYFPFPKGYTKKMSLLLPNSSYIRKPGYKFLGWYENAELTGNPVTEIPAGSTGDKTFWAKWEENPTVTVYVKQGMSGDGSEGAPFGSIADAVSAITSTSNYPDGANINFVLKVIGMLAETQYVSGNLNIGLLTIEGASELGSGDIPQDGIQASSGNLLKITGQGVPVILKRLLLTGTDTNALQIGEASEITFPADVIMDSDVIIDNNHNTAWQGGGVYVDKMSSLTMKNNCKITNNSALGSTYGLGGGVYLAQNASFNMQGGEISGNTASVGGSGIYVMPNVYFYMGGNAVVTTDNDVALGSNVKIVITSELTGTVPVATITPAIYSVDTQVIDIEEGAETTLAAESAKFKTKSSNWSIGTDGKLVRAPWNYSFHNNIEVLPAGTLGENDKLSPNLKANAAARYVLFGDYPRSHKADDVTIDTDTEQTMGNYTYYLGSDGEWYAKHVVKGNSGYYASETPGERGASVENTGTVAYFKLEPIMWRVLTTNYNGTGKALLITDEAIPGYFDYNDSANTNHLAFSYTNDVRTNRTIGGKTISYSNYQYSNARAWLNGLDGSSYGMQDWTNTGFINTAFTSTARAKISETLVDNSASSCYPPYETVGSSYDSYLSENTTDKVFLLSVRDVTTSLWGFEEGGMSYGTRCFVPTDLAIASRVYRYSASSFYYGTICYLRTPGDASTVKTCGGDGYVGNAETAYNDYNNAMVPAIVVDLSDTDIGDVGVPNPNADSHGLLNGLFSVGDDKQVQFSMGNLQYRNSEYHFAERQSFYCRSTSQSSDSSYLHDMAFVSSENAATITIVESDTTGWRMLSADEWQYLLETRNDAASKFGVAKVIGLTGLVILPDNWTLPAGLTFNSGYASDSQEFADINEYTVTEWDKMEKAGAIFLPACGSIESYMNSSNNWSYRRVDGQGLHEVGGYWTADGSTVLKFKKSEITYLPDSYYHNTRLVMDVN